MKFDTSIIIATLAASAVAAPAPFAGVAKRWVDTSASGKLPAQYAPQVRRLVKEKAMNKRQLDQLLGGLLGGAGGAGGAAGGAGAAGGLGDLLGGAAGKAKGAAGGAGAAGGLDGLLAGLGAGGANAATGTGAAGAATSATAGGAAVSL
jgi:hypothetical protein